MTYSIDGVDYSNTTGLFSNLDVGTYYVTAKSGSGCISPQTTAVVNPPTPAPVIAVEQPNCTVGTGTITITSPTSGVTYSFDNGATFQTSNKVTIQVQVKAHDAAHSFLMGDANYRFNYDRRVIRNPAIVSQENFSNQAPSSDFNYNAQTLQGSSAGLTLGTVSLNTIYGGGGNAAKLVPTTWTTVSCIRFDVQDPTKCFELKWHNDTQFPITGMNEVVLLGSGNYDLYVVSAGGIFTNYSECIPSVVRFIYF